MLREICRCEHIERAEIISISLGSGRASIALTMSSTLFYRILGEKTGMEIHDEGALFRSLQELSAVRKNMKKSGRPTRTSRKLVTALSCLILMS